ncbi:M28 family metallopeptidase [Nocardioides sp.]|uniref:M28 family metallopeptidase n=1 Tax=Nocardioides sp. TaxID=35761 RepID=UPI002BFAB48E|nr:M28 family metallopeptidase [Nocardioides sp.]HXH81219.1 M28 family metallopeptidase [Nocardioides sp.]
MRTSTPARFRSTLIGAAAATALAASALTGVTTAPAVAAPSPDLSVSNATAHLQQFQNIATANGGNRATGRPGYKASLDWVKSKLDAVGYATQVQSFSTSSGTSYNLIADWPGGSAENVVMVGAHLDSVASGPGINDNGTGSASILEAALAWAASGNVPRNHLRFAWWGAEEQGLLGSNHYMRTLPTADKDRIRLYQNYDMTGSINPAYFVYNDNAAGNFARDSLTAYYDSKGIPWEYTDPQGRSDHASFRSYGLPTTGIFSGAEGIKTTAQAQKWGGTAGRAYDPCYHSSCDTMTNLSSTAFDRNLDAIGHMIWLYADKTFSTLPGGNILANPGFESGATSWTGTTGAITSSSSKPARTGTWKAWLGGNGATSTENLTQTVTIPATATAANLTYWIRTDTAETGSTVYDTMKVQIVVGGVTSTLRTFSNVGTNSTYTQFTHSLLAHKGKAVTVKLLMNEDSTLQTSFVVDDTAVSVS